MKAVILAAGTGSRLAPLSGDRPKPLVAVGGRTLLDRTIARLGDVGIAGEDVIVVAGYREDVLRRALRASHRDVTVVSNPRFADWNNFWSLRVAEDAVAGDAFLQIDGDLLFDEHVLPRVLVARGPGALAVSGGPHVDAEAMKVMTGSADGRIVSISKALDPALCLGESIGLARIDPPLGGRVFVELATLAEEGRTGEYYEAAYERLARRGEGPFLPVEVSDCMAMEIDDLGDLDRAEATLAASLTRTLI